MIPADSILMLPSVMVTGGESSVHNEKLTHSVFMFSKRNT